MRVHMIELERDGILALTHQSCWVVALQRSGLWHCLSAPRLVRHPRLLNLAFVSEINIAMTGAFESTSLGKVIED